MTAEAQGFVNGVVAFIAAFFVLFIFLPTGVAVFLAFIVACFAVAPSRRQAKE